MAFDGIILKNITNELKELINGKINKIQQSSKDNLTLSIYNQRPYNLYIDISANNYRVHLTNHSEKNLQTPSNFCMVLRKYITSAKITNIYSLGLERILYIEFETYNEMNDLIKRYLVCELMGKYSNILLLNEHFNIIDALKKFDGNDISRDIMPGRHYSLPNDTKNDFTKINESEFIKIITNSEFEFFTKLINRKFPDYEKIVPSSFEKIVEIPRDKMVEGIKSISMLCEMSKITIDATKIKFESISEIQDEANNEIDVDLNLENEISFVVKSRNLMDFLTNVDEDKFTLKFKNPDVMFVVESNNFMTILVPKRA